MINFFHLSGHTFKEKTVYKIRAYFKNNKIKLKINLYCAM